MLAPHWARASQLPVRHPRRLSSTTAKLGQRPFSHTSSELCKRVAKPSGLHSLGRGLAGPGSFATSTRRFRWGACQQVAKLPSWLQQWQNWRTTARPACATLMGSTILGVCRSAGGGPHLPTHPSGKSTVLPFCSSCVVLTFPAFDNAETQSLPPKQGRGLRGAAGCHTRAARGAAGPASERARTGQRGMLGSSTRAGSQSTPCLNHSQGLAWRPKRRQCLFLQICSARPVSQVNTHGSGNIYAYYLPSESALVEIIPWSFDTG